MEDAGKEEEETIHELPKDETDQGNLDDQNEPNTAVNEDESHVDPGKPEDMDLSEDLNLDIGNDQEGIYW